MGVHLVFEVRDDAGRVVDLDAVGVDGLVELIRGRPPHERLDLPAHLIGHSVDLLVGADRVASAVAAVRAAAVCAVAEDTPGGPTTDQVVDEVSIGLTVSRRSAQWTRDLAETLRCHAPVWTELATGRLDMPRARILARALGDLPHCDADGVDRPQYLAEYDRLLADGLAYAAEHTSRQLEIFLRRRLAEVDPALSVKRRRAALRQRGVWVDHQGDGTAYLTALLASEDAERVHRALRAVALADRDCVPDPCPNRDGEGSCTCTGAPCPDVPVTSATLDEWMAHSLVDLVTGTGSAGRVSVATQIHVTIPIQSLAGLTDQPGTVSGFGVIPAEVARRLAAGDARWRHVLTRRESGVVLDVGTLSYRPPTALDRHVRLRDVTCRFPGCLVPARECDLDHLLPFPLGPTSEANLHALCRRHHRLKHEGGWRVDALPDSALRWTSPLGSVAVTRPEVQLPRAA